MDYSALIQNRKSVRTFQRTAVADSTLDVLKAYFDNECPRLTADSGAEICFFNSSAQTALEGAAGYENYMIGAPTYMVILADEGPAAEINAGYMAEEMILKMADMDLGACWVTFADADEVAAALKLTGKKVVAIVAFGFAAKARKFLQINVKSMSNVDIMAKRGYFAPKKSIYGMTYVNTYGNQENLDELMGFYDDMLWESLYACTLAPSFLNRQPWALIIRDHSVILVDMPDAYTDRVSADLGLGIVMRHFEAVMSRYIPGSKWEIGAVDADLALPEGCKAVASYKI